VPPRLAPELPLPRYAYVSGQFPHPISDPAGHSFGRTPHEVAPPDPDQPRSSREFLFGCDLFNHGYYWEAHEEWEGLWHACGRKGVLADFLKALIHLAAAGVKAREGRLDGVRRHAARAAEILRATSASLRVAYYMGLDVQPLIAVAARLQAHPVVLAKSDPITDPATFLGLGFYLIPVDTPAKGSTRDPAHD